jgi:hypothetical protein
LADGRPKLSSRRAHLILPPNDVLREDSTML